MAAISCYLECPICKDAFDEPRILPCGHTYCFKCLQGLETHEPWIICPICRKSCSYRAANLPVNYQFRDLMASLKTLNLGDTASTSSSTGVNESGVLIAKARYHALLINLAFGKAVEKAFTELAAYVKLSCRSNNAILKDQKADLENIKKSTNDNQSVDANWLAELVKIRKMEDTVTQANDNIAQVGSKFVSERIETLKSALSKFEVHAIGDQMNAESVISVISVAFFVYLYHGIERFEQRFTRNVVEMLQAQQPKERVWICIIGNFASIEYYGQTFIRIYKFFGRRLVVYDFITTDCTEFVHDAGDVQTLLEETAQEHEGKQNLAALVHDSMVEILGGDWHCAVFDENVKFSISFSDASKIRKFETKSKQNQIIKLWTVIK